MGIRKNKNQISIFNRVFHLITDWELVGVNDKDILKDTDIKRKFCSKCPFASRSHLLEEEYYDSNSLNKLCSISAILKGFATIDFFFKDLYGCCIKDNDRHRAEKLLKNLKINKIINNQ